MNPFNDLISFLKRLEKVKIDYSLEHNRPESIMVLVAVPGERWEIEFFEDGSVEVERFMGGQEIEGKEALDVLFSKFSE